MLCRDFIFLHYLTNFPTTQSRISSENSYKPISWQKLLTQQAPESWRFFDQHAQPDPFFAPLLSPPPVRRLWSIYGVNVPTEVTYYLKKKKEKVSHFFFVVLFFLLFFFFFFFFFVLFLT